MPPPRVTLILTRLLWAGGGETHLISIVPEKRRRAVRLDCVRPLKYHDQENSAPFPGNTRVKPHFFPQDRIGHDCKSSITYRA